jgi:hypothetical protein
VKPVSVFAYVVLQTLQFAGCEMWMRFLVSDVYAKNSVGQRLWRCPLVYFSQLAAHAFAPDGYVAQYGSPLQ